MNTMNTLRGWSSRLWPCAEVTAVAFAALALATSGAPPVRGQAQTYTVLHSFSGADGANSHGDLIRDAAGNLYGTTAFGGTSANCSGGCGTVFELNPSSGVETVLHSFSGPDGAFPAAGVIMDAAGNFYGTTVEGGGTGFCRHFGCGTVFKLDTTGNLTVLYAFIGDGDGGNPVAGLVMDAAGNLYGTTSFGGNTSGSFGVVFKVNPSTHMETVVYNFQGFSDGARPAAALIMDAAGNLYGTTPAGGGFSSPTCGNQGAVDCGTVFEVTPSIGAETVLYRFKGAPDGASPVAPLIMDTAGNLYGTTSAGGTSTNCPGGCGTAFKLNPSSGVETVLRNFTGLADGASPQAGLTMDAAGNLYSTTSGGGASATCPGCGTVFKLDASDNETLLRTFAGSAGTPMDGAVSVTGLSTDGAGGLYGTTVAGGASGLGTVFKLSVAVEAPPTITSISPASIIAGGAGFTLTVNGTNFVSGSTVSFNGSAQATTLVGVTQLTALIPAADIAVAGTFHVTVTNPAGETSNAVSFTVLTPQQATEAIINAVNALFSQGMLNGGQDNSLVKQLEHAIVMMNAGKNAGAAGNLESFIGEVDDLLNSGVLSPAQAGPLVSAVQNVIARLS
jgi:uncharacterized repeat protein (TIGR03803 family)